MLDAEERKVWQAAEDREQIVCLRWQQERKLLKNAVIAMPRVKEEYHLSRRICCGYKDKDISQYDLTSALDATFMLDRHAVVSQQDLRNTIGEYLSPAAQNAVAMWDKEQNLFDTKTSLDPRQEISPLSVARLFSRIAGKADRDPGFDVHAPNASHMDIALFFGVQSESKRWSPTAKRLFRKLAEDETWKFLQEYSSSKTISGLIWKEMHDIIVKDNTTELDHLKFGLVGTVGQRMGFDLEEKLLESRQKYLKNKPVISAMLTQLRKEEQGRHSLLGHLGLNRVRSVRG